MRAAEIAAALTECYYIWDSVNPAVETLVPAAAAVALSCSGHSPGEANARLLAKAVFGSSYQAVKFAYFLVKRVEAIGRNSNLGHLCKKGTVTLVSVGDLGGFVG